MVDGFRYGFYGVSDIDVTISISILVVLTILLTSIALYLLEKGTGLKN
jgi:ABC-2 type transport system permease protein